MAAALAASATLAGVPGLGAACGRVVRAFSEGEAQVLRPLLPSDTKIFLELKTLREARGYFGAHQVVRVFDDFFSRHEVVAFEPEEDPEAPESSRTVSLTGVLTFRAEGGRPRRTTLSVVLVDDGDGWVLREIRERA